MNERIKKLRKQHGYTQRQLAEYLNISQSLYALYEQGKRNIKFTLLEKICNLYGCELEYILYGEGTPDNTPMFSNKKMELRTIAKMNKICRNLHEMIKLSGDVEEKGD